MWIEYLFTMLETLAVYSSFVIGFEKKKEYSLWWLVPAIMAELVIVEMVTGFNILGEAGFLIWSVYEFVIVTFLFKGNAWICIYIIMLFNILISFIDNIVSVIASNIFGVNVQDMFIHGPERTIIAVISKVLLIITMSVIGILLKKIKGKIGYTLKISDIWYVVAMALFVLASYGISDKSFYNLTNLSLIIYVMIFICLLYIMILVFKNKNEKEKRQGKEQELEQFKHVMRLQEHHMDENIEMFEKLRCLRHDIRDHVNMVKYCYENSLEREGEAYLDQIKTVTEDLNIRNDTRNSYVDAVLNIKYNEARKNNIYMTIRCEEYLDELKNPLPVSIIFNNALNNAIEACMGTEDEKQRKIEVIIQGKKDILVIINNFSLGVQEEDGNLITSKDDFYSHGIGMKNINNAVNDLDGIWKWYYDKEKKIFTLKINWNENNQEMI